MRKLDYKIVEKKDITDEMLPRKNNRFTKIFDELAYDQAVVFDAYSKEEGNKIRCNILGAISCTRRPYKIATRLYQDETGIKLACFKKLKED